MAKVMTSESQTQRRSTGVPKDVLSPTQRRRCMASNKGRDTRPEVALRRACWALGLRYTLRSRMTGRPDFIFPRERVAVFVDGCFWHVCPEHYIAPATRAEFWRSKLQANRARDEHVNLELAAVGWQVLRFWEHDLKTASLRGKRAAEIRDAVLSRRVPHRVLRSCGQHGPWLVMAVPRCPQPSPVDNPALVVLGDYTNAA